MKIAFFDFDGTITTKDTLIEFIRFAVGSTKLMIGFIILTPMLILFKLKLIPNYKAKQLMLGYFFKNMNSKKFQEIAIKYSLEQIDKIVRPQALKKIAWHKEQGHEIVIVSASIECWLNPWCEKHELPLISTKLEVQNDILTGSFITNNCHGQEKVDRIKKQYDLTKYEYIYAYGDSSGDKEMLQLADEKYYKPFRD